MGQHNQSEPSILPPWHHFRRAKEVQFWLAAQSSTNVLGSFLAPVDLLLAVEAVGL